MQRSFVCWITVQSIIVLVAATESNSTHSISVASRIRKLFQPSQSEAIQLPQQAPLPAIPLSDASKAIVLDLWSQVEQHGGVARAERESVIAAPAYIELGPDPQKETPYASGTLTTSRIDHLRFPNDFIVGVTQAATATEGAVKADGRGPSVWDSFAHLTGGIHPIRQTFDIATNFRYLYPLDIARLRAAGFRHFAFSISWSRVFPTGYGDVSQEGLQFYVDLVDECIRQGIEPIVTLFHWDLPLQVELHYGGFASERIVDDFVRYASIVMAVLGPRGVKMWFTFDSPYVFCTEHYPLLAQHIHGHRAAARVAEEQQWKCVGHTLKAHGKTFNIFSQLRANGTLHEHAQISIKLAGEHPIPFNAGSKMDKAAVQRMNTFRVGTFAEPIFKTGRLPEEVRKELPHAWLPSLTPDDEKRIKGSADFMASNYYASSIYRATEREGGFLSCLGNSSHVAWPLCTDRCRTLSDGQEIGEWADDALGFVRSSAGMLRTHLRWLYDAFPSRGGIYVTTIGWAERGEGGLTNIDDIRHDVGRQAYLRDHLGEMLLAIYKDGTPLKGVLIANPTDGIDFQHGSAARLGLQYVNFTSQALQRTFLGSIFFLRTFFKLH